jgi:hypothetical protein
MKPGFMPWFINGDEAELVIAALRNFVMAYKAYVEQDFEIDFEGNETLFRFYDNETDMWYNTVIEMPKPPFILPKLTITDDLLISKLKKKKKNRSKLGFSMSYLPMPIQESKNHRPKLPRLIALTDMGKVIDQIMDEGHEFVGATVFELLTRYIENNGRPASIAVENDDTKDLIEDFATKLGIKITENEGRPVIGNMLMRMMDMMESGQFDEFMEGME